MTRRIAIAYGAEELPSVNPFECPFARFLIANCADRIRLTGQIPRIKRAYPEMFR